MDKYYTIFHMGWVDNVARIQNIFGGGRHAVFFALPLMSVGAIIRRKVKIHRYRIIWLLVALVISSFLSFMEISRLLSLTNDSFYIDISIFNWMPAVIIFLLALKIDRVHREWFRQQESKKYISATRMIRKMSDLIYIFHPAMIWLVARILGVKYESRFLISLGLSVVLSWTVLRLCYLLKFKERGML